MNRRTFLRLPALAALDLPKYKVVTPHQAAAKYESAADGRRHRQISSNDWSIAMHEVRQRRP